MSRSGYTDDKIVIDAAAKRVKELEAVIRKAIQHAEKNGMKDWPVFKAMRREIE